MTISKKSQLALGCLLILIDIVLSFAGNKSSLESFTTTTTTTTTSRSSTSRSSSTRTTDTIRTSSSSSSTPRRHHHNQPLGGTPQLNMSSSSSSTDRRSSGISPITTTVGFLGCGTIASAIATGLLTQKDPRHIIERVHVTKRSEAKSSALKGQFQDKIVVSEDMQEILNHSDLVFLCVLPEQVESVLKDLKFDTRRHTLVSLVSTSKLKNLVEYSRLPSTNVYKMICLPAVAELEGTPLLVPRPPPPSSSSSSSNVSSLIGTLGGGTCVECDNEEIMEAMMVTTCMMGSVYEFMRTTRDFLVEKGVPARDANHVVARQYWGMTKDALTKSQRDGCQEDSLDQLIQEQTPGGLNEQALRNLDAAGVFDRYKDAMEVVLERIQGQGNTNGS